jgi:hypothetical protein
MHQNLSNYIMGTKRTGLPKNDMISYILGIFSNEATKNTCLKYVSKYFEEKTVKNILNSENLKKLLYNSNPKIIRNIYELCVQDYKHVAQYRDDSLKPQRPLKVASADGFRYAQYFMTFENYCKQEYETDKLQKDTLTNDLYNKLSDIEDQLKNYMDQDLEPVMVMREKLQLSKKYLNRAIYNLNPTASLNKKVVKINENFDQARKYMDLQHMLMDMIDEISNLNFDEKLEKCKDMLSKCLDCLVKSHKDKF